MTKSLLVKAGVGAAAGFVAAFKIDVTEFRKWVRREPNTTFDFRVAAFRWLDGAIFGAIAGAGLASFTNPAL